MHTGFAALDLVPHVLTAAGLPDRGAIHVVEEAAITDKAWLKGGVPSTEQQAFGTGLLQSHPVVLLPSAVAPHSWNLVFMAGSGSGLVRELQEPFVLDPRLQPPAAARSTAAPP